MNHPNAQNCATPLPLNNVSCLVCQSRRSSEWCALSNADLGALDGKKTVRRFNKGDYCFRQGEACNGIYCVVSGIIALEQIDGAGNTILSSLRQNGDTLGYRAFFSKQKHSLAA